MIDETDRQILRQLQRDATTSLESLAERLSVSVNTCWRRVRRLEDSGVFIADTILAKHDENYMAPEVADSLVDHVSDQTASLSEYTTGCNEQ